MIQRSKEVQDCIDLIEEMLLDEQYEFAEDFLTSVLSCGKESADLSDAQIQGVNNVFNSK